MPREHKAIAISIRPELLKKAKARAEKQGFGNSFSAYVTKLIRDDLEKASVPYPPHRNHDISTAEERPTKSK
jgi:hypothetical protein